MKKSLFFLLALFSIFTNISCEEELPELYGNIHGIVYDKVTSEPIRGAEITLAPGNKTTVTGFNGQYEFNDLDPMQYEIQVSADGYSTNSRLVTAIAGESVICDITLSIIKDVDGVSLGNSFFDFGSTHTEQTLIIKNIGNKGAINWEITNLDAAWLKAKPMNGTIAEGKEISVKLTADRSKLTTDEASTTFMVNAAGGSQSVRANISKHLITGVMGTVKDANDGHVIKDCIIKIVPGSEQKSTDENGNFKITGLSTGEYTLTFEKSGYTPKTHKIITSTGELVNIDVVLMPLTPFEVSEETIDFAFDNTEMMFSLKNNSDTETSFTINNIPEWLTVTPTQGVLSASSEKLIIATLDRKEVNNGSYSHNIHISYHGRTQGDIQLKVNFTKSETATDSNVWDGKIAQKFSGGSGNKYDPYIIKSGGELLLMKDYDNKYFKLVSNIDLNNKNWLPIAKFSGTLDGNGCTLYNLRVERDDITNRGLIGDLNGGTIKDLNIHGVKIKGDNVGAVAGRISNNGTISNCKVRLTDASVLQGDNAGGIVGYINCSGYSDFYSIGNCIVESSNNNVAINGSKIGGIVGYANSTTNNETNSGITNCKVYCNIIGENYVGGIAGNIRGKNKIQNCGYWGEVCGTEYVGGICGMLDYLANIEGCKADANIEGDNYIGGISGSMNSANIIASYSCGTIKAASSASNIGGISGASQSSSSKVTLCYSATTCTHSKFNLLYSNTSYTTHSYSIYNTTDIAKKMEEEYSDYAYFWNYNNIWTCENNKSELVECPRLAWEE